jgi:DNA phosphorothioation-dependent restriction protein DptG
MFNGDAKSLTRSGVFKEIHKTAQQEVEGEAEHVAHAMSELYMQLETGEITDEQFEQQEKVLLDRLDEIWERDEAKSATGESTDTAQGQDHDDE